MRFESSSTMTVIGEDVSPPDGQLQEQPPPHLAAVIKWWVSCVWGVAGLVLRHLLRAPPAIPALPALGRVKRLLAPSPGAPPSPSPAEPESSVTCTVLCDPADANVDVIFVHGLYGSLANTWKQGQWRSKHKTGPKRIPLKRHASLPENNYVNDVNNNAKIHKEPRVKKNKSEEYCSCDNRYYKINVNKQSDIRNNNSKTILKNNGEANNDIRADASETHSSEELTQRRQSVSNIIGRKISRTETIKTLHIEQILKEIVRNPTLINVRIDEIMKTDDHLFGSLEKFINLNNNNNDLMKIIYENYMLIKDMHRNEMKLKSILNIHLTNTDEEYRSLGNDLNEICDRIEYFISKFNSPTSEVGYRNVYDKNIYDSNNIVFNRQFYNNNDVFINNSEFSLSDVAIEVDKRALNNNTKGDLYDCDNDLCNSLEELNHKNELVLEDLQNVLPSVCDNSEDENKLCVENSKRKLKGASLDNSAIKMENRKKSENKILLESDKEMNSFLNETYYGNNGKKQEKELRNKESNSDLKDRKEVPNNANMCQKIDLSKTDDLYDRSEVSEDGDDGRSCEDGCGCVCSKCYSTCWPRDWLRVDCPRARVIAVNYTSDPYLWRPIWIKEQKRTGLQQRADEMVHQLLDLGVGQKPIVWVGHSKGGLFIKQIYTDAYESYCASQQDTKESSVKTEDSDTDQSKHNNAQNLTNSDNNLAVEELTNDNFSVRLETELNEGGFMKNEITFEESFAENITDMVSDVKGDLEYHKGSCNYNTDSNLGENCGDYEEYMLTTLNIEEMEGIADTSISFDDSEHKIIDKIKFDNQHGIVDKNEKLSVGNSRFEDTPISFDRDCENQQNTKIDRDSSDVDGRESDKSRLWSNTKGFMFYSVPHRGSPLAGIRSPLFARSVELLEISENCASVLALQGAWLRAVRAAAVVVRSFVETARTLMAVLWLRIVSVESADAGVGELCGVGLDHREICKPSSRACFLYRELLALIRRESTQEHTHAHE